MKYALAALFLQLHNVGRLALHVREGSRVASVPAQGNSLFCQLLPMDWGLVSVFAIDELDLKNSIFKINYLSDGR